MSHCNQSICPSRNLAEMCDTAATWQHKADRLTVELNSTQERLHAEIDRLKQANETLLAAVSCASIFLWATDRDGKLTLAEGKGLENLDSNQVQL